MLFQSAVELPQEQRQVLLNAARIFTEMGGMEDMLLGICNPGAVFLTAEDLQLELEEVRTALQAEQIHSSGGDEPVQKYGTEMEI